MSPTKGDGLNRDCDNLYQYEANGALLDFYTCEMASFDWKNSDKQCRDNCPGFKPKPLSISLN